MTNRLILPSVEYKSEAFSLQATSRLPLSAEPICWHGQTATVFPTELIRYWNSAAEGFGRIGQAFHA